MTLAVLFDWFALDSKHVAEQTDDPKQRERWMSWQSCGRPPHDRAVTKRSPATLPPRGLTSFAQAKGQPGQRGPGCLRIRASNTRSSQGLVFWFTGLCPQSASTLLGTGFWNNARLTKHN